MDQLLIDKADTLLTKLQRRGLHLLKLKVWWSFAALVLALFLSLTSWASGPALAMWLFITLVVFGGGVFLRLQMFKENMNYPEEHRTTQRLNALVSLVRRTRTLFRHVMLFVWSSIVFGDIFSVFFGQSYGTKEIVFLVLGVVLCSDMYIDCCMFCGPGEHSREKKAVFSADMQRSS